MESLGSDVSEMLEPDFWLDELTDVQNSEFCEEEGPTHNLPPNSTALDYFKLLLPMALIQLLVHQTNLYAEQCHAEGWDPVTLDEMRAYIGILIIMGVNQLPRYNMYWSKNPFLGKFRLILFWLGFCLP